MSLRLTSPAVNVAIGLSILACTTGCVGESVALNPGELDALPCTDRVERVPVHELDELARGCDRSGMVMLYPDGFEEEVPGPGNNHGASGSGYLSEYMAMNFGGSGVFAAARECETGMVTMWGPDDVIDRVVEGFGEDPFGAGQCLDTLRID
jgi:hypothetical protein